ncbi:HD domain-containing protein [Clostridium sporogenes]|uniref:HD domain-containing protein n=1 Tax=Clostridium sporogenes TaxID=1509 RepID=A0A7X5P9G4_CLOSG|nr:HD domain-containing protein [Clostridium sporogenes]AJD30776.1 poly A polymerase head domain protein [Clostridium botulinum Prevot_594]NFQ16921.1 HD domain-containing protein [Clostridium sporogenes]NFQ19177.1 HD domain-containing protein [Clostridium sporogenes]NFQ26963.1 HD domain-containing protein [Clostridium sporogenes]NFR61845.1 HD domain-containing protein [Clostridium sporogenes]
MLNKNIKIQIPKGVKYIINTLQENNREAYIVGGAVRDSLLERKVNDWDITTSANPQEVVNIFENLRYKIIPTGLKHGTVTILINSIGYEITTFRIDGEYEDNRHPKEVKFTSNLKEDLKRRDLTINAMAYNDKTGLVDYFNGLEDLNNKIVRCVGNSKDRFNEDSLRMLRCIRFASQLNFDMEKSTKFNIRELSKNINNVSMERIRDELCKILVSSQPVYGIRNIVELNLVDYIIPELKDCVGFQQHNKHHDKDVYGHILSVVENVPNKLELRLAALLHDIGKPKCFSIGDNGQGHFYGHQKISADMTKDILKRLKFDNKTIDKVDKLVYNHMTRYNKLRIPSIKKFINKVGIDNLDDLFELQIADIKGSAKEYHSFDNVLNLKIKCEKILSEKQPLTIKDLDIDGHDLMKLGIKQGKEIGIVLNKLLDIILENPNLNNKEDLIKIVESI